MRWLKTLSISVIALLLMAVLMFAAVLMLLRYKPEAALPFINQRLQSYQIQILQFDLSEISWNKLEFKRLKLITAAKQQLQLSKLQITYSLPARQLNSLSVGQFELLLTQVESKTAANGPLIIEPYLVIWRELPALTVSVPSGRVELAGRQLQFSLQLSHGQNDDLLVVEIKDKSFVFNTRAIHRWQQYSRFELENTLLTSRQGHSLFKLQQLSLQQQAQGYRLQLQADLNLASSWQALASWLPQLPVKPVLGGFSLALEGELDNDLLAFNAHQLQGEITAQNAIEFELQVPPIGPFKKSTAAAEVRLSRSLQLKWQQGLQLTTGSVELQVNHAIGQLNASVDASACNLQQCQTRYNFLVGQVRWPEKDLPLRWSSLSSQGSASWAQQRLTLTGEIKLSELALPRQGVELSPLDLSVPKFIASVDLSKKTPRLVLQLPLVIIDDMQVQLDSASLRLSPSLSNISLDYQQTLTVKGEYQLGQVLLRKPGMPLPEVQMSGDWNLNGSELEFSAVLHSDKGEGLFSLNGRHSLNSHTGSAQLNSRLSGFDSKARRLSKRFTVWPYGFDLLAGQFALKSSLRWSLANKKPSYSVNSNLKLDNLGLVYQDIIALGLNYSSQLSFDGQRWRSAQADTLTLEQLDVGLVIDNIQASLRLSGTSPSIEVKNFSAQLLQGTWQLDDFNYAMGSSEPQALNIRLRQLQLAELIASAEYKGLEAQASISGDLPLILIGSVVTMKDGKVYADKPGYIRYTGLPADGNQLLGLVSRALSNYHFASLTSTAQYRQDGNLDLAIRMQGENPDMQQKVNVNLNLNYDIPSLLKSLRAGRAVSDMIEEKLKTE